VSEAYELDQDDKILAAANDVIGIFQIISFGKGVYLPLAGALGLILLASAAVMVSARVLGQLVETLVAGAAGAGSLPFAASFLALETAAVACQYFGRVNLAKATIEIIYGIRRELFAKMRRLPISYFDATPLGRTITRLTSDVEGIETFFGGTLARVLIAGINIVAVLVAMLVTDLRFGAIIVGVSLPALAFSVMLRRPVIFWLRTYKRRSAHLNAKLAEFLNGLAVIRIFGLEGWTQRLFDEAADELLDAGLTAMNWNSFIRPVAVFLCSLPTLLILWLGGQRVLQGALELGTLVAFVRFSERFVSPIRVISTEIQNIQEAVVSSERVRRMLREPEEAESLGPDGTATPALGGRVEYQGVWMGYGGRPVLKGVDFVALPGTRVGLVGATGSGKSTTVNLLPRLYPFQQGRILLDGVPIETLERDHLRDQLGYVSQDVVVFAGTVRANLLASTPGAPLADAQVLAACRKTGLDQVLAGLAGGLDHLIVEGGENLSMGERQLIAFTRMILRDPRILILDEATANIDERCEKLIQEAITEVMAGRTSFVIAHRLSTIIQCDLILVFAHGEIVERGTHAELMAGGGLYARLTGKQMLA
jgi:ABC-type multidrug transport system fused ATPase/permease subunit